MTEEQKDFITQNHNLIYSFLKYYKLPEEEFYDLAAIGLCNSVKTGYYNKDLGNFSTYAYKCMLNEVNTARNKERRGKRIPREQIISLDEKISEAETNNDLMHMLKYIDDTEKQAIEMVAIIDAINKLSVRDRTFVQLTIRGYKMREIAQMCGVSYQLVNKVVGNFRRRLED